MRYNSYHLPTYWFISKPVKVTSPTWHCSSLAAKTELASRHGIKISSILTLKPWTFGNIKAWRQNIIYNRQNVRSTNDCGERIKRETKFHEYNKAKTITGVKRHTPFRNTYNYQMSALRFYISLHSIYIRLLFITAKMTDSNATETYWIFCFL